MLDSLADAIRANDLERARHVLTAHPELASHVNDPVPGGSFGGLAIGEAVRHRNAEMLDLLLAHGADINAKSDWWAGGFGVLETCDPSFAPALIDRGARVDVFAAARLGDANRLAMLLNEAPSLSTARGGDGKTALHYASTVDVAELLLQQGAHIDARDVDHESTPAQYLIGEHPDVASHLVSRGARADIILAAALGDDQRVARILDEAPSAVRTRVNSEWFPMQNARAGGSIYIWTIGGNKSAFTIARERGHQKVVALLAERAPREMMLAEYCLAGDAASVRALLSKHLYLASQLTSAELCLLPEAAFDENVEAVQLMLDAGWPVSVTNAGGATALHSAAWHGHAALVRMLLRAGARVDVRDKQYDATPLGWAEHGSENSYRCKTGDYVAVMELLRQAGG